jgi:uncharacterized membrane-anchored protein YhcB (DUF1043 family)
MSAWQLIAIGFAAGVVVGAVAMEEFIRLMLRWDRGSG